MSRLLAAQIACVAARDAVHGEACGTIGDPHRCTEVTDAQFAHLSELVDELLGRAGLTNEDVDATKFFPLDVVDLDLRGVA